MLELMFLLAFTLHNIEEAIWLPRWSRHAGRYHPEVSNNQFHFALLVITVIGYLLTFLFLVCGKSIEIIRYFYLGFVLMMCLNAIFPHLGATIVLRRYAPGTLTGLLLNLPIGLTVITHNQNGVQFGKLLIFFAIVTIATVSSLRPLFRLGSKLIDEY